MARARFGPISIRIELRPVPFGIGRGSVWLGPGPVNAGAAPMTKAMNFNSGSNWWLELSNTGAERARSGSDFDHLYQR